MHRSNSRRASHYPISVFLSKFFRSLNINVGDFVGLLGYKNRPKGIARLDQWLGQGFGKKDFIERVIRVFPDQKDGIAEALSETDLLRKKEVEAYERATFRPCIYLETKETRPSSIAMFAISGGHWKYIPLPVEFSLLPQDQQIAAARAKIQKHQSEGGYCRFFGPVTGYRLVPDFDSSIRFDILGNIESEEDCHFTMPGRAYMVLR